MGAFTHLNADHLLIDSCSFYSYSGTTEASTLEKTNTYAAAVTTKCNMTDPQREWGTRWPAADLTNSYDAWLPEATAAKPQDKIVYDSVNYRILAVSNWGGFQHALIKRIEGFT